MSNGRTFRRNVALAGVVVAITAGASAAAAQRPTIDTSTATTARSGAEPLVVTPGAAPVAGDAPFGVGAEAPASPTTSSVSVSDDDALSAYWDAGYTYSDVDALAAAFGTTDPLATKIAAGRRLLAGGSLPVAPDPASVPTPADRERDAALNAFIDAGYTWSDLPALAAAFGTTDELDTKVTAGKKLLAGETLPVAPSPDPVDDAAIANADRFLATYTYDDAVVLATAWKTGTWDAKVAAGAKLAAGDTAELVGLLGR